jgi:ABC-type dipeptide/oligopeptide/nickel transport system permease component
MVVPPLHARPAWLPIRLWLGGAGMAALFLLANGSSGTDVFLLLLGLPSAADPQGSVDLGFFSSFFATAGLLLLALITALAVAFTLALQIHRLSPAALGILPVIGRFLASAPLYGLLWVTLSVWISETGGVVETLLPDRPYGLGESWSDTLARRLWTTLAPTLALALPLAGLLIAQFAEAQMRHPHTALQQSLRARGLSPRWIQDRHLLPLWLPEWCRLAQSSLFFLIANALVVESVLRFPGAGSAFIKALQLQEPRAIAIGIYTMGILAALLSTLPLAKPAPPAAATAAWSKRPLLPPLTFLGLALAILVGLFADTPSPAWLGSWQSDAIAVGKIALLAALAGPIVAALRLTVLGDWLRRYGLLETLIWSPLLVWVIAWSHAPGRVVEIDQTLAVLATIAVSVRLHACTRRLAAGSPLLAAKVLGATPWQAWRVHARRPWQREFAASLLSVAAGTWWLRMLSYSLFPIANGLDHPSIGSYLGHRAMDALQSPLPMLHATLIASVSVLFLWTLSRIIHPHDDL